MHEVARGKQLNVAQLIERSDAEAIGRHKARGALVDDAGRDGSRAVCARREVDLRGGEAGRAQ